MNKREIEAKIEKLLEDNFQELYSVDENNARELFIDYLMNVELGTKYYEIWCIEKANHNIYIVKPDAEYELFVFVGDNKLYERLVGTDEYLLKRIEFYLSLK